MVIMKLGNHGHIIYINKVFRRAFLKKGNEWIKELHFLFANFSPFIFWVKKTPYFFRVQTVFFLLVSQKRSRPPTLVRFHKAEKTLETGENFSGNKIFESEILKR